MAANLAAMSVDYACACSRYSARLVSMSERHADTAALEAYLLGTVDFDDLLALQRRLVYEVSGDRSRRHPNPLRTATCDYRGPQWFQWAHFLRTARTLCTRLAGALGESRRWLPASWAGPTGRDFNLGTRSLSGSICQRISTHFTKCSRSLVGRPTHRRQSIRPAAACGQKTDCSRMSAWQYMIG